MSTRSTISYQDPSSGVILSIYCHFDGYLEYNGRILLSSYQNPSKIKNLMMLGDLSQLDHNIDSPKGEEHSYKAPAKNTCVFTEGTEGMMTWKQSFIKITLLT